MTVRLYTNIYMCPSLRVRSFDMSVQVYVYISRYISSFEYTHTYIYMHMLHARESGSVLLLASQRLELHCWSAGHSTSHHTHTKQIIDMHDAFDRGA